PPLPPPPPPPPLSSSLITATCRHESEGRGKRTRPEHPEQGDEKYKEEEEEGDEEREEDEEEEKVREVNIPSTFQSIHHLARSNSSMDNKSNGDINTITTANTNIIINNNNNNNNNSNTNIDNSDILPDLISDNVQWSTTQLPLPTLDSVKSEALSMPKIDESPETIEEEWERLALEERTNSQSYEEMYDEYRKKLLHKRALQEQLKNWECFLNYWQDWSADDLYAYLVRVDNKRFAKYFSSVEDVKARWSKDHSQPFRGYDLRLLDREDLYTLGIRDKDDRKILADHIRELRKNNI
ncbi:hypothetical protein RFI_14973, partial [Reticulomyxa filosa]